MRPNVACVAFLVAFLSSAAGAAPATPGVAAVTLRAYPSNAAISTADQAGNFTLTLAPGQRYYIRADTTGAKPDRVDFVFADGTKWQGERTAPYTFGLQLTPAGWLPKPGRYDVTITPYLNKKPGALRKVSLIVREAAVTPAKPLTPAVTPAPAVKPAATQPAANLYPTIPPSVDFAAWYVRTEDGFTALPLAPGARDIFAADWGNDANDGSLAHPVRTLQKAAAMVRDGTGDRVRPFAGSVFYGEIPWARSGKPGAFTGIIAYGEGERPRIETKANGIRLYGDRTFVAFSGLHITSTNRNPFLPGFDPKPLETTGIDLRTNRSQYIIIEDCRIQYFGNNVIAQTTNTATKHRDIRLLRDIILDAWAPRIYGGQGVYGDNVDGMLIQECLLDHNGWLDVAGVIQTGRNQWRHNYYGNHLNAPNIVLRDNWIWRAAAFGSQERPGGMYDRNFFWDNSIHASTSGALGTFQRNLVFGNQSITPSYGNTANVGAGAIGFTAASSQTNVRDNYFWGRPLTQVPGLKYPGPAVEIRRGDYTPPGDINVNLAGNGFVCWPAQYGPAVNYMTNFGKAQAPDWKANFVAKVPDPATVWPNQVTIDALRNRPLRHWVKQFTPAAVYGAMQKANGR